MNEILTYVMNTPENVNPIILKELLLKIIPPSVYYVTSTNYEEVNGGYIIICG